MPTIKINGMSCGHCVRAIENALNEISGVSNVKVDLEKGEASFEQDQVIEAEVIIEAVGKAGYQLG
jgi:copper chaperone